MGDAVGLASSSSVAHQLKVLETKGFLRRDPNRPRALEVLLPGESRPAERRRPTPVEPAFARRRDAGERLRRDRHRRRLPGAGARAGARPDRRRRPDPGRGADRGRLRAPPPAGRRGHDVPARGQGRLDDRGRHLRRRLGGRAAAADGGQRRHRGRAAGQRGDGQDLQAQGRAGVADCRTTRRTTRSTATTPRSWARSSRSCAGSEDRASARRASEERSGGDRRSDERSKFRFAKSDDDASSRARRVRDEQVTACWARTPPSRC